MRHRKAIKKYSLGRVIIHVEFVDQDLPCEPEVLRPFGRWLSPEFSEG